MKDTLKLEGALTVRLNGAVVQEIPNLVVNTGKSFVASRMVGTDDAVMGFMAIGTGTDGTQPTDTTVNQVGRVACTTARSGAAITYEATFGPTDGDGVIAEAGIFNDASAGTMLCRTKFTNSVGKTDQDSMTITWTVTVS